MAVLLTRLDHWQRDNNGKQYRLSLIVFDLEDALKEGLYNTIFIEEPHIMITQDSRGQFVDYTYVESDRAYIDFSKSIYSAYSTTIKNKPFIEKVAGAYHSAFNNILDTVYWLSENPQFKENLKKYLIEVSE